MREEQKKKLLDLRTKNKKYIEQLKWKNNVLLQECLEALGEYRIISDEADITWIKDIANSVNTIQISHCAEPPLLGEHVYYVVWDNLMVPIIECKGNDILAHWDDVMAVAFDTCFVDRDNQSSVLIR